MPFGLWTRVGARKHLLGPNAKGQFLLWPFVRLITNCHSFRFCSATQYLKQVEEDGQGRAANSGSPGKRRLKWWFLQWTVCEQNKTCYIPYMLTYMYLWSSQNCQVNLRRWHKMTGWWKQIELDNSTTQCRTRWLPCRTKIPLHKVWLTPTARVPCSNAANIRAQKTRTQSQFCTWQNSLRGQEPPKDVYIVYHPRRRPNVVQSLVDLH